MVTVVGPPASAAPICLKRRCPVVLALLSVYCKLGSKQYVGTSSILPYSHHVVCMMQGRRPSGPSISSLLTWIRSRGLALKTSSSSLLFPDIPRTSSRTLGQLLRSFAVSDLIQKVGTRRFFLCYLIFCIRHLVLPPSIGPRQQSPCMSVCLKRT